MAKISVQSTEIPDLYIIQPTVFEDDRGYFLETYHQETYREIIPRPFVQSNESCSGKGVLRGLHLQLEHPQAKLVRVICGSVYDVAVDLRKHSPTFGRWVGVLLSGENKTQFYIPRGFAHGFVVLEDHTIFTYQCDDYYHPQSESGIRYDDPTLAIPWQDYCPGKQILSAKDRLLPSFEEFKKKNPF